MIDVGSAVGYLMLDTSKFNSGFKSAMKDMQDFNKSSATTAEKFTALGTALTSVGTTLSKTVTLPLVGLGAAAVTVASNFEASMSQVQATMGITAESTSELNGQIVNTMDSLSDLAKEMGSTTKFSASEAAAAINNMAMAGYSVNEIYSALPEVLNLASAGALDLDYATQLAANGLNVMGLGVESLAEMSDKLAVTASSAYGSVADFGEGLLVAGGQAKLANLSLTETFTALGILGDNGMSASEGGTMLRNVLKNLYTPTDSAAKVLKQLGIETADAEGNLLSVQDVLKNLNGAMSELTDDQKVKAMSQIFDTRTIAGANALLENSSERWDELASSIDNADGAAKKMADTQLNNLSGRMTILKSAIEGLAISFGEIILPMVTKVVEGITGFIDKLNALDDGVKKTIVTVAAIAAAAGPVILIVGKLSTTVGAVLALVSKAGGIMAVMGKALAVITGPIGIAIGAMAALALAWKTNFAGIKEFTSEIFGAISDLFSMFFGDIKGFVSDNGETISESFRAFLEPIENVFRTAFDIILTVVKTSLGFIAEFWETNGTTIMEMVGKVFGFVVTLITTAMEVINTIITTTLEVIKYLWESDFLSIQTIFENTWAAIQSILENVLNALSALLDFFIAVFTGDWEAAWEAIKTFFSEMWEAIKTILSAALNNLVDLLIGIAAALYNAAVKSFLRIKEGFTEIWDKIKTWFEAAKEDPVKSILSIASALYEAGRNIMGSLWDGLKSMWESIKSWFEGVGEWITSKLNLFKDQTAEARGALDGSYASGLDYVPRDMVVRVHEGESIRTKQQTEEDARGGGDTFIFQSPKALTPSRAAQEFYRVKRELALGFI